MAEAKFLKTIEPERLAKQFNSVPQTGATHALMDALFKKAVKHNQEVLAHNKKILEEREAAKGKKTEPIVVDW